MINLVDSTLQKICFDVSYDSVKAKTIIPGDKIALTTGYISTYQIFNFQNKLHLFTIKFTIPIIDSPKILTLTKD